MASGGFATSARLVAALALGAQGIDCGTAFLATTESFAHDDHKARVLAAKAEDTVHNDIYALNWPPNTPVRVIRNSVIGGLGPNLMGATAPPLPSAARGDRGSLE
ncbi:nitronate monooxygenase [Cypionkella psychrotolerans]|uniref:nitronate monooxygenase n=1 Tax=Cypionkella psychrotolerans TaxID=1678131 RepID=UPI0009EA87B2